MREEGGLVSISTGTEPVTGPTRKEESETAFLNKYVLIGRRQHTVWSPEDRFHRGLEKWLS